jgi:hypothetical protein
MVDQFQVEICGAPRRPVRRRSARHYPGRSWPELGRVAEQEVVPYAGLVERTDADEVLADVGLRPRLGLTPADEQLDVRALRLQWR